MQSPSLNTRGNRIRKAGVMGVVLISGDVHAGDRVHVRCRRRIRPIAPV